MNSMISVIVSVYNIKEYIAKCIDSILTQTYSNIELILVDDGSDDGSGRICDRYAQCKQNVSVIHKKNGGLISARKAGIRRASGDFITLVDGDDWIDPDFFKQLLHGGDASTETLPDICVGAYVVNTDSGSRAEFTMKNPQWYVNAEEVLTDTFEGRFFNWSLCGKLYKKHLFRDLGRLWEIEGDYGEDTEAIWKLLRQADTVMYMPVHGYHYYVRKDSMMQKNFALDKLAYLDRLMIIMEEAKEMGERLQLALIKLFLQFGLSYMVEMLKLHEDCHALYKNYMHPMEHAFSCVAYVPTSDEKKMWQLVSMGYDKAKDDILCRKDKMREECRNFVEMYENLFIYGTGGIAKEIFLLLEEWGISCDGFIVTSSQKDGTFMGRRVVLLDDFQYRYTEAIGIFLCMNEKNVGEVMEELKKRNIGNFANIGKYSIFY